MACESLTNLENCRQYSVELPTGQSLEALAVIPLPPQKALRRVSVDDGRSIAYFCCRQHQSPIDSIHIPLKDVPGVQDEVVLIYRCSACQQQRYKRYYLYLNGKMGKTFKVSRKEYLEFYEPKIQALNKSLPPGGGTTVSEYTSKIHRPAEDNIGYLRAKSLREKSQR